MGEHIEVVEVGPRDGFQNVEEFIPFKTKLQIIDGLVASGIKKIEVGSFVSPKAIPQMKDTKEIVETVLKKYPDQEFFALVPNLYGAKAAVEAGLKEVTVVMSLSESHNLANIKRTHEQSYEEIKKIREELPKLKIRLGVATTFGCPFEGELPIERLIEMLERLTQMGIREYTLCDTVGLAYPTLVEQVFRRVKKEFPDHIFHVHIHDTRNMGLLNSYIAMKEGAASIEATVGGLGGCPFAPGASGNTSTEDLVYMLNKSGYETGIDFQKLLKTAKYTATVIDGNFSGHQIKIEDQPTGKVQE